MLAMKRPNVMLGNAGIIGKVIKGASGVTMHTQTGKPVKVSYKGSRKQEVLQG